MNTIRVISSAATAESMITSLKPELQEKLDVLTRVAELLGTDDLSFSSYASAITRLSAREEDAQHSINRLELVERELQAHLATMGHEERLIESWIEKLDAKHAAEESTSTLERRREALLKRAKEDRAILEGIDINPPAITFAELTAQQTANEQIAQALKTKRAQVKAFRGLPPNLDSARQKLKAARAAQMELIQLRERLLGRMAASVV